MALYNLPEAASALAVAEADGRGVAAGRPAAAPPSQVESARACARYLTSRERGSPAAGHIEAHSFLTAQLAARFVVDEFGHEPAPARDALALGVEIGARLHDIGLYAVSPLVVLKPGPLTPAEEDLVRRHPRLGAAKIEGYGEVACARAVVLSHHERWDGRGYPDGLAGAAIPLPARIVAIFDAFASLVSGGVFHGKRPAEEALGVVRSMGGSQFDPELAERAAVFLGRLVLNPGTARAGRGISRAERAG